MGSHDTNPGRIAYTCTGQPERFLFDVRLKRQVITSPISNALKYSPHSIQVEVNLSYRELHVIPQLTDHGIGISSYEQANIFESFHRAAHVGGISGTGLGLSNAKQVVELHGGTITLWSQTGTGITFMVLIPN